MWESGELLICKRRFAMGKFMAADSVSQELMAPSFFCFLLLFAAW